MKKIYTYKLLSYRHSKILNESITIGFLLYSRDEGKIEFLYPSHLHRLSSLYENVSTSLIRKTLRSFSAKAVSLSKSIERNGFLVEDDFDKIVSDYFLEEDATALSFCDSIKGYYEDFFNLKSCLQKKILSMYDEGIQERYDESRIEEFITKRISKTPEVISKFKKDISLNNGKFVEKFPYSWKNGKENILVPISFDLDQVENIKKKSYFWYGLLESFDEISTNNNYNFDLFVTKPRIRENWYGYENALSVLENANTPLSIYEEEKFELYLDHAIDTLLR